MSLQINRVEVNPTPAQAGGPIEATCWITSDEEIESVAVYLPNGEVWHFQQVEKGKYSLKGSVPWEASPGVYDVTVVARSKAGNVDRKYLSVEVL